MIGESNYDTIIQTRNNFVCDYKQGQFFNDAMKQEVHILQTTK